MIMEENQNIEYKESWHDEYLRWIYLVLNMCAIFYVPSK